MRYIFDREPSEISSEENTRKLHGGNSVSKNPDFRLEEDLFLGIFFFIMQQFSLFPEKIRFC
jgi:hypothetical protein